MLAALAVMEGYRQLHVAGATPWHPSADLFALIAPLAAVALTRRRGGGPRTPTPTVAVAVGATVVLCALTPQLLASKRPMAGFLVGAADIATAILLLGAVIAAERTVRWSPDEEPREEEDREAIW